MTDLDLRTVDSTDLVASDCLTAGSVVSVYSERFDEPIRLKITHTDRTLGGTIVSSPSSPLLGESDHVHFNRDNVVKIIEENPPD